MTTGSVATAGEREVRAYIRRRRKQHDRRSTSDKLINGYMWVIGAFYIGTAVSGLIDADLTPQPGSFHDIVAWLPLGLLIVVWAVLRFATWQGPVLFPAPELQWVVSSPLSRRGLVLPKLRRALVIAAVAGSVGGVVVAVLAEVMVGGVPATVFGLSVAGMALLTVMATALSWHVERSVRWSGIAGRSTPVFLALVALVAFGAAGGHDTAVWWSGPWGWAAGPIAGEAGRSVPGWIVQLGLLALAAAVAVVSATATAERFSEEELWRRADAHSSAAAALFFGDVRTLRTVARRERTRGRIRGRTARMMRFAVPWLAISARDVLTLRRNPRLVVTAAMFTAAAFAAAVAAADQPLLAVGAFIGLYAAASRLLEPLRLEADRPGAHWMLPWSWGTVIVMHCLVPTIALAVLGWMGLAVVGGAGLIPPTAVWPLVLVAPFAAAAIVTPAAVSAARKPFPIESLISGTENTGLLLVLWLVAGPVLAAIVADIAFGAMRESFDRGVTNSTFGVIGFLGLATLGFVAWLGTRKPPD